MALTIDTTFDSGTPVSVDAVHPERLQLFPTATPAAGLLTIAITLSEGTVLTPVAGFDLTEVTEWPLCIDLSGYPDGAYAFTTTSAVAYNLVFVA